MAEKKKSFTVFADGKVWTNGFASRKEAQKEADAEQEKFKLSKFTVKKDKVFKVFDLPKEEQLKHFATPQIRQIKPIAGDKTVAELSKVIAEIMIEGYNKDQLIKSQESIIKFLEKQFTAEQLKGLQNEYQQTN